MPPRRPGGSEARREDLAARFVLVRDSRAFSTDLTPTGQRLAAAAAAAGDGVGAAR